MNPLYFLAQIGLVLTFTYGALRLGKGALTTAVAFHAIVANLFVLKQINLLGFQITCSDAFAIGSILALNLLREYYGKDAAKKATTICFFFMVFFVAISQIHLRFFPSPYDTAHFAYERILTPSPRLLIASLATFYIVQQLDIRLFGWISTLLPKTRFPTRSSLSLSISQLFDTLLFSFLGLYGMVSHLNHIILISFLIKLGIIFIMGPLMSLFGRVERHV